MKTRHMSHTAMRNAVLRALESYRPRKERLFEDPFARRFLNLRYRAVLNLLLLPGIGDAILAKREAKHPGIIGNFLCRTRYIDDVLNHAIGETLDQVVLLGAGFDSRPYRIPKINQTHVIEVDHQETQSFKRKRLARILSKIPEHVNFVPADFNRQNLEEIMTKASFCPSKKTFFIWEGVTQYISAEAVDDIFRYISRVVSPESSVVFTYIKRAIINSELHAENGKTLMSHHERLGEPWIFGLHPEEIQSYLNDRGFSLIEQVGAPDYRERYLRPRGRQMNLFDGEVVTLAQVKGAEKTEFKIQV